MIHDRLTVVSPLSRVNEAKDIGLGLCITPDVSIQLVDVEVRLSR